MMYSMIYMKRFLFITFLVFVFACGNDNPTNNQQTAGLSGAGDVNPQPDSGTKDDFNSNTSNWKIRLPNGNESHGEVLLADDALSADGHVANIVLRGDSNLDSTDLLGPVDGGSQISTKNLFGFGTYRVSVKLPKCNSGEEIITGIFVYSHDGSDINKNGIEDNNEVDIEFACSDLNRMVLTIWTDYKDDSSFIKNTRIVDMTTGDYVQTELGKEGTYELSADPIGTIPEIKDISKFDPTGNYYEMGFEWHSDHVRYFIVSDEIEITLWDFTGKNFIPQNPASFMLNVWHTTPQWFGSDGEAGGYPKDDVTLSADWFKYWAE